MNIKYKRFRLRGKCLFLTYSVFRNVEFNNLFSKEEILDQLKKIFEVRGILIDKFLICYESINSKVEALKDSNEFRFEAVYESVYNITNHCHVYLELNKEFESELPSCLDLKKDGNIFHGDYRSAGSWLKKEMSVEDEENELELRGFIRRRNRTIGEHCLSYLLKEDLSPFSNFEIKYLNKVYNDRDPKLFVRKVTFGEEKLKLYVVKDERIEKLIKADNLDFQIFDEKLKTKKNTVMIIPSMEFLPVCEGRIRSSQNRIPTRVSSLEDLYNLQAVNAKIVDIIFINLNLRDTKTFHQDILVCGLDTTFIEGKKIELKGKTILVYFKDLLKENPRLKEFLSKISNEIIEMDENFKMIINKEELFLNRPITLNVNIDNRNGNFLSGGSNSIELLESVKNFQKKLENIESENISLRNELENINNKLSEMREFVYNLDLKVVNLKK